MKERKAQRKKYSKKISARDVESFQGRILDHYRRHKRELPWRKTRDPYRIYVSEMMLQQTQVDRVIPKYTAFIQDFPDFTGLAGAPLQNVLAAWQGLGYNRRAMALSKAAKAVVEDHKGKLPRSPDALVELPGIGPYTAAAICVFAFNQPLIFVETNIRAVYLHIFFQGEKDVHDDDLLPCIEKTLYRKNPRRWYNALMDYGAVLKKLYGNPARRSVHHTRQSPFQGSDREIRGAVIKALIAEPKLPEKELFQLLDKDAKRVRTILSQLQNEGFIAKKGKHFVIA